MLSVDKPITKILGRPMTAEEGDVHTPDGSSSAEAV